MKYVATLLTVHNRRAQTLSCLRSLLSQEISGEVQVDVFLVDDGCTDGTAAAVKELFPNVNIISGDGSLFWNRGMYLAWNVASGERDYDYYLWLNDDVKLLKLALRRLLAQSAIHDNNAIIVGATQNERRDELTYGGRIGWSIAPCNGIAHEVDQFNGNIVLVPRYVYEKLGNIDDYYRHSKGDIDYSIRARKAGVKIYQCGEVLGICEAHTMIDDWCNPAIPFSKRWRLMHMPNGMPPHEIFHLEKQENVIMAAIHFCTVYLRCLFPQLWKK